VHVCAPQPRHSSGCRGAGFTVLSRRGVVWGEGPRRGAGGLRSERGEGEPQANEDNLYTPTKVHVGRGSNAGQWRALAVGASAPGWGARPGV
jgi:hypothetical protein